MFIDENTVKVENCIITWDGVTAPDIKDGKASYSLGVAISPNAPEMGELDQIANKALSGDMFKGVMPNGGRWPLGNLVDAEKLGAIVAGMLKITGNTQRMPSVYDVNGNKMDPTQFSGMLYAGCKVAVLLHAYPYNNINKGIAFGLDGFQIVDAAAPRLDIGGGMNESQVAGAFAGNGGGGQNQGGGNGGGYQQNNGGGNQGGQNNGGGGQNQGGGYQQNNGGGNQGGQNNGGGGQNQGGGQNHGGGNGGGYQQNNGGGNQGGQNQGGNQGGQNNGGQNNGSPVQSPGYMTT